MKVSSMPANSVTIKVLCMVFALISDINIKLNKISIIGFYLNWFSLHMMRWYCIRASLKQLENNSNYTSRILLFLCLASQYPPCLPVRLLAPLATVPRPHAAAALQQLLLGVAVPADSANSDGIRCCCGSVYACDLLLFLFN